MAFAEVSDIAARLGRELTIDEQARAEVLINDASAMLAALVDTSDAGKADLLRMVCCSMVIRVIGVTSGDAYGVDSMSVTAGPYAQTWNYSSTAGDMYLTKAKKRMLGITGGYIGSIRPMMAGEHDD